MRTCGYCCARAADLFVYGRTLIHSLAHSYMPDDIVGRGLFSTPPTKTSCNASHRNFQNGFFQKHQKYGLLRKQNKVIGKSNAAVVRTLGLPSRFNGLVHRTDVQVLSGLSLLLVLIFAPRGFPMGTPVFCTPRFSYSSLIQCMGSVPNWYYMEDTGGKLSSYLNYSNHQQTCYLVKVCRTFHRSATSLLKHCVLQEADVDRK